MCGGEWEQLRTFVWLQVLGICDQVCVGRGEGMETDCGCEQIWKGVLLGERAWFLDLTILRG